MNKLMTVIGLALVVAAMCAACYFTGRGQGAAAAGDKYKAALVAINAEHTRQLELATTAARADERRRVMAQDFIDRNLFKELNDEKQKTADLSAALRAGAVQLRQRFTCPASTSGDVPSTATSASPGDAAQGRGLQREDAQFLVQLAGEADQVAVQLKACQALISSDRNQPEKNQNGN